MRKIITRGQRKKKETFNKTVIGLVLVALMVLSTAGYAFFSGSNEVKEKKEYNNVEFVLNENGLWQFEIQGVSFSTLYFPDETENISVGILTTVNNYPGKPLFFTEKGSTTAKQEIGRNLQNFVQRIQEACIQEEKCENEELPIKNCSQDNVIIIKDAETVKIIQEENCVFISSPYQEQARAADAFLFKILGLRGF